jgi:hypothetical protein
VAAAQRNVLIGLGTAILLVVAVLAGIQIVGGGSGSGGVATATGHRSTSTSTDSATVTTIQLVPVEPATALGTLPPLTTGPTVQAAPSTTPPGEVVDGTGAILVRPASPGQRRLDPARGCASLADSGWGNVQCGVVRGNGAVLTWLTEARPGRYGVPATRTYVFRAGPSRIEEVALEGFDDQGSRFSGVKVRVDSVAADGFSDIVFGFRNQGTAQVLSVDVVHGPGMVAVHRDLAKGAARTATGQLDTWSAVLATHGQDCCPKSYEHDTIREVDGAWRIVARASVAPDAVPPSQF